MNAENYLETIKGIMNCYQETLAYPNYGDCPSAGKNYIYHAILLQIREVTDDYLKFGLDKSAQM